MLSASPARSYVTLQPTMLVAITLALGATPLLRPSAASAASVTVRSDPKVRYPSNEVYYVADAGERNDLLVSYPSNPWRVTVTDRGAIVRPPGSCSSIDVHSA